MPEVSIVIPAYNSADTIIETIQSIFNQTFSNYEIIIIDDGSTDDTKQVLEPYMHKIEYYAQRNQGQSAARNEGIQKAKGDFIAFLDDDDLLHPDNLKIKLGILKKHPEIGAVFSDFRLFNKDNFITPKSPLDFYKSLKRYKKDVADIFREKKRLRLTEKFEVEYFYGNIFDDLFMGNFILTSSFIARKKFADEIGWFKPDIRAQEDYEFYLRFSKKHPMAFVNETLVDYRRGDNQLTGHSYMEPITKSVVTIIDQYRDEFSKRGEIKIFKKRKAGSLVRLSEVYLGKGLKSEARNIIRESIRLNPCLMRNYLNLIVSYIPVRLFSLIRTKKKLLFR
jgi:glycosyltransferase involved in cell wall biosynthesis